MIKNIICAHFVLFDENVRKTKKGSVNFDKAGIGYKPEKRQKFYKNFFSSTQKYNSPFITCFYYGRKGHGISKCYFRKICNNIKMIWVPKGSIVHTNTQGPNKDWIPKSQY